jgi:murein DD-endopeptidase MepM/ murein hydrolase activator NlpD
VNDVVEKDQIIGLGGATGNARGSHLHFEIRYKGICVHPEYAMDFSDGHHIRAKEMWVTNGWINPLNHSSYMKSPVKIYDSKAIAEQGQKSERKIYVVKKGDTLIGIAKKNNMYVRDLLAMNSVKYNSILRIGQHLVVRQ